MAIGLAIGIGIAVIAAIALGAVMLLGGTIVDGNADHAAIKISNAYAWISPNRTTSVVGFVIQNTGQTPVSILKIIIGGKSVPTDEWFFNNDVAIATSSNVKRALQYDGTLRTIDLAPGGDPERMTIAAGPLSLEQDQAVFIYLANPTGVSEAIAGSGVVMWVHGSSKASAVEEVIISDATE